MPVKSKYLGRSVDGEYTYRTQSFRVFGGAEFGHRTVCGAICRDEGERLGDDGGLSRSEQEAVVVETLASSAALAYSEFPGFAAEARSPRCTTCSHFRMCESDCGRPQEIGRNSSQSLSVNTCKGVSISYSNMRCSPAFKAITGFLRATNRTIICSIQVLFGQSKVEE